MSFQAKRTIFVVLLITSIVFIIGITLPILYSSATYRYPSGIGNWTPLPSRTATTTPHVDASPTLQPSATVTAHATPTLIFNCVFPLDYWTAHPELWPEEMVLGGTLYDKDDIDLIFKSQSLGIREYILQNLYIAFLNIYSTADSQSIMEIIIEANDWLQNNPSESQITEENHQLGLHLAQTLIDFNTGILDPDLCPSYGAQILTPVIIEIPETPVPTIPTDTPSATPRQATRRPTQAPTRTRKPTDKPPKPSPEPATNTPRPQPTSTPFPSPEPTEGPPTPVPTKEPSPTPVP